MTSSFEMRRRALADHLRLLRERGEHSAKEFAALLGWTPSKLSKIETGRQTPTDVDLITYLEQLAVPADEIAALREQLRELRIEQVAWRRELRAGHRARQQRDARSEQDAAVLRGVATMIVPGLLQTPDYARAVLRSQTELLEVPDDVDAAVAARMERQRILYEPGRIVEILIAEAALRHPVASPEVMVAQLDRLISAVGLPGVRFGMLPLSRPVPYVPLHGFWIVDDVVEVETVTSEVRVTDSDQVAIYQQLADRLWSVAVEGDDARALLARIAAELR